MASWSNPIDWDVGQATCVQRFDDRIIDNIDFAGSHGHTGAVGDGATLATCQVSGSNAAQSVYQYVTIPPFTPASIRANDSTEIDSVAVNFGNFLLSNSDPTTVGASVQYLADLHTGTWAFQMYYGQRSDAGIISVCIGGTFTGCIDTYTNNGTLQRNRLSPASNVSITASGQKIVRIIATASNVSSTGYRGWIEHIALTRLSA